MSPNLGVLPPEVQRICSLLPLQVAWHNSYQGIFVLCCWLWHASSRALNCGKMCLPQLTQSQHYNPAWKGFSEVICTNPLLKIERVVSHPLLACSPEHPNTVHKIHPEPLSQATVAHICSRFPFSVENLPTKDFFKIAPWLATKKLTCQVNKICLAATQCANHGMPFCSIIGVHSYPISSVLLLSFLVCSPHLEGSPPSMGQYFSQT